MGGIIMNSINKKLKSTSGETLLEVLLASFLGGIALLILASMITASHRMIDKSSEIIEKFYEDTNKIENQTAPFKNGTVTIKSEKIPEEEIKITVKIFSVKDSSLAAYTK